MRRRRQHDVAVRHALGHRHLDADREHVVARQPAAHAVLVGMHDDRIVVVDEQRAQRRIDVVLGQMPADIDEVERAGARRRQIRPLQPAPASWETRCWRRARCRCPCPACRAAPAARSARGCRCRRCGRAPARCPAPSPADRPRPAIARRSTICSSRRPQAAAARATGHARAGAMNSSNAQHMRGDERVVERARSAPVPPPATTPAARRCRAAVPDADRPARRSWCAAGRPPPACRPCASPGGCSARGAGW